MSDRFALLIGAMKSGTTALYRYLEQHREIAPCSEKEPNFFCDAELRDRGFDWYRSLWDLDPSRHRWALDGSTAYTKLPVRECAAFHARRSPGEYRFLYLVRNPIDRIRSQYLHSLVGGWITEPIHRGIAPQALLFSNYAFQLAPYEACHGRDRILVLSHEELCADAAAVLRRVCGFLEIDPTFPFLDPGPQNSSHDFRKRLFARLLNERGLLAEPIEPVGHGPYADFVLRCETELAAAGHAGASAAIDEELERSITPSPEQEEQIRALLGDDLARFADRYGVDSWGEPWRSARTAPPASSAAPLGQRARWNTSPTA